MRNLILTSLLAVICIAATAQGSRADYRVVPLPDRIDGIRGADFRLTDNCIINYPTGQRDMERNAALLSQYVEELTGMHLSTRPTVNAKDGLGNISLLIDPKMDNDEGYRITIMPRAVEISGRTAAGVFYGIQTLRKSLPAGQCPEVLLPAAQVSGSPQFGYRGMHLDCVRHFFGVETVKRYIDIMALHGMNRLHWHLTDDQGWRIEIKKYPRLAEVGGWRNGTTLGHNSPVNDGIRYGGYFTQEEIRDIVRYAADRYITIIPEIDMPGHMVAALTAYPELGCTGGPYEVWGMWGVHDDILCMGKDHTLQFVQDVLDEVMELFPSRYIHIGGDEAPRVRWEQCPLCQKRISDLGIHGTERQSAEALLQGWFTTRIQDYLSRHGRSIIGWDELLGCDVDASATIMSWRGAEPGAEGAKLGHDVIMSPTSHCYFDYYQTKDHEWGEPFSFANIITVETTYSLDPAPKTLSPEAQAHILGAQANLWTEYIAHESQAFYQVLPRMGALCEVQWVMPEKKDYKQFVERERRLTLLYKHYGWPFAPHIF